ncbi:hypothetical protein PISMIDRAFT_683775 [Pisolithus microcarpus 441]|uniref:Uncharacterized protein n=1 Tax=Pisolithus microcarpus 441 TaxID=765257 RepID=A0A0C9ZG42_9AGAM|nr:hypothetical protein PISMIDRAFT_683775 [Pisolithus microcarpus 441]
MIRFSPYRHNVEDHDIPDQAGDIDGRILLLYMHLLNSSVSCVCLSPLLNDKSYSGGKVMRWIFATDPPQQISPVRMYICRKISGPSSP